MLKELLEKRNKNEQLSEDELNILKEYDENISNIQSQHKTEFDEMKNKFSSADSELQETLKKLSELEKSQKALEESKQSLEEMVKKSENIEDVKIKLREDYEKKAKEKAENEKKQFEELAQSLKKENEEKLKQLQEEIAKQKEFNEKLAFKTLVNEEIVKRPYAQTQLKMILDNIDTTDLNQSKNLFNFVCNSYNHDVEMENYKKRKEAGSNIFTAKLDEVDKELRIKNKQDEEFEEFLKRNPNIR